VTRPAVKHGRYTSDFQSLRQDAANRSPSWLQELRDLGWARFDSLGFPTARRGNERWKYTNVAPIARADFAYPSQPGSSNGSAALVPFGQDLGSNAKGGTWLDLVFVDGRLSPELSSTAPPGNGLIAAGFGDNAALSGGDGLQEHLGRYIEIQDDGFAALNTAFLDDGAFVKVPDGYSQPVNLRITYVTTGGDQPKVTHPRSLIVAGRNTQLTVVETYAGSPANSYFTNAVTEVTLGEGANVDHYRLLLESPNAFHVGTSRVRQGKDSTFTSASFALGTSLARNDLEVLMDAPGGYCSLNGLYLTADGQHIDNLISIDHAQPNCTSRLNYKGILDGKSRAVFGGTVIVRPGAQKSDAEQTDKNLLLSENSEVDSKPSLLIYADDVKCSHGATAGHMNEDTLFYLRSRGLDLGAASRMLIHAFATEIIDSVKPEPLREHLDALFNQAIPDKSLPYGAKHGLR
jgi:Fe-S cluster assembly protein SufD